MVFRPSLERHPMILRTCFARARCPRAARRTGATAVEFALVAPILFIFILGIIEFNRAFMVQGLLTDAARHGSRKAIIAGATTQQITDAAKNYLTDVGISTESVQVTINDGNGNVTEAQNVPSYTEITVNVSVDAGSVSWLPAGVQVWLPGVGYIPISISGTLTGQFTMRRE
jgi:Flp pilus assembly protein TadG